MKWRESFLYGNKTKIMTLFNIYAHLLPSPLSQHSAILEFIPWTQNAYSLLQQPGLKDALFALKSEISTRPCVEADVEDCTHLASTLRDGRWSILAMLFIFFWTLTVKFTWQSMGQYINITLINIKISLIQNILNCVPKTNKTFTCLERHVGKWKMTKLSFWGGVSL